MKSKEEIKKAVETSRGIVREIYENDPRLQNEKNQGPNSGITTETNIVFQEILRHVLNN